VIGNLYADFLLRWADIIELVAAVFSAFVLGGLSFYFAWQKIGYSIQAGYSLGKGRTTAFYISSITLINRKNRPVPIFAIWVLLDNTHALNVLKPDKPIILPPHGAESLTVPPVSLVRAGLDPFDFKTVHDFTFWIVTTDRLLKCRAARKPAPEIDSRFSLCIPLVTSTNRFNGHVYDDETLYAIVYREGEETRTAFVDTAGFISGQWELNFNRVHSDALASAEKLKATLDAVGTEEFLGKYFVDKLDHF
jgi:hypothetical protein